MNWEAVHVEPVKGTPSEWELISCQIAQVGARPGDPALTVSGAPATLLEQLLRDANAQGMPLPTVQERLEMSIFHELHYHLRMLGKWRQFKAIWRDARTAALNADETSF